MIVVEVIKLLVDKGFNLDKTIDAVAKVPMQLTDEPWAGLLWDPTNRRMIMSGDNRALAERLLAYGLTGNAEITGRTEEELRREWAGILQTNLRSVTLPIWVKLRR